MTEQRDVTRPTLDALNAMPGVVAYRVHAGKVRVRGGWMQLASDGAPDIIAAVQGRWVGIETKRRDGRARLEATQIREHTRLRQAGATVIVVQSARDAVLAVEGMLR